MPRLRGLGNALSQISTLLLKDRLDRQQMMDHQEQIRQRQLEVAKYNKEQVALEGDENRRATRLRQFGENPSLAVTASQAGDEDAPNFIEKDRQILGPAFETLSKAKNPEDVPSMEALFASRKPGIITNLNPISELSGARNAQLQRVADTTSEEVDKAGAIAQQQALGQAHGKEEADATNFDAQLGREVKRTNTLNPIEFRQQEKLANMRATVELEKQKKYLTHELATRAEFARATQVNDMALEASKLVLQMTELTSLAAEINAGFQEGAVDTYAGIRNAFGSLPYVGGSISQGMATASAAIDSMTTGDKSIARKVNNLEGMRRAAGIAAIRAAGDPRPSNADVEGVIGSIPGAYESLEATAAKSARFRDSLILLPEIMTANPGIKGKALLDIALAEATKRSNRRAIEGGNATPPKPTDPRTPTSPPAVPPSVQSILSR